MDSFYVKLGAAIAKQAAPAPSLQPYDPAKAEDSIWVNKPLPTAPSREQLLKNTARTKVDDPAVRAGSPGGFYAGLGQGMAEAWPGLATMRAPSLSRFKNWAWNGIFGPTAAEAEKAKAVQQEALSARLGYHPEIVKARKAQEAAEKAQRLEAQNGQSAMTSRNARLIARLARSGKPGDFGYARLAQHGIQSSPAASGGGGASGSMPWLYSSVMPRNGATDPYQQAIESANAYGQPAAAAAKPKNTFASKRPGG